MTFKTDLEIKFTSHSRHDKTYVTVNLAQFDYLFDRRLLMRGDRLLLTVDGQDTIFVVNRIRNGVAITAATHCFPGFLRRPKVGKPVYANVTGGQYV